MKTLFQRYHISSLVLQDCNIKLKVCSTIHRWWGYRTTGCTLSFISVALVSSQISAREIVTPEEERDQRDCVVCLKFSSLKFNCWDVRMWKNDNSDGCCSELCQHFSSSPRPQPVTKEGLTSSAPCDTRWVLVIYKCNPLLHTYNNCLQLEVAAMTFLWEMKISEGAEQPILDSAVN